MVADTVHSTVPLNLSIAHIPVTLRLNDLDGPMRARWEECYAAFMVTASPSAFSIDVRVEPGPPYIPLDLTETLRLRTPVRDDLLEFESHFEIGWLDFAARKGEITLRPQGDVEFFLRAVYAWLCLDQGAFMLHASGVIRQGRGYVFFGPSGSGKTTVARLSLDGAILSDDAVIIKRHGPMFRVYGVPFRGEFREAPRSNAAADLCGLYLLIQATEHRLEAVSASEAVARLSACAPFVMRHPANARRVAEFCADLVASVPVRALRFRQDAGFWSVIDGCDQIPCTASPGGNASGGW
jgi:hypothetical protein